MIRRHTIRIALLSLSLSALAVAAHAQATQTAPAKPFEPQVGQAGKDVVWVPTPQALVDKMLDMAQLTPQDFIMDLGSGDGRTVITAAQRGSRALGVEYNPEMVMLATKNAIAAGVTDKASFVKADLFETDFSKAQVITMFLLPSINMKLRPTLLNLKPGTRIVSNSFTMEDWEADQDETISGDCVSWCTAHLWIVPAKVDGTWQLGQDTLTLKQAFQHFTGTLGTSGVSAGNLSGENITFNVGTTTYTGKVNGTTISGKTSAGAAFTATKK